MTITHTIRISHTGTAGGTISGTVANTADAEDNRSLSIAAATTDKEVDIDIVHTRLVQAFFLSTQDLTIETNATDAAGGDTITLKANVPVWYSTSGGTSGDPFSADVTKMYITNAGATAAQLDIRILYDSTP